MEERLAKVEADMAQFKALGCATAINASSDDGAACAGKPR